MASTYQGGQSSSSGQASMLGFGPSTAAPYFGGADPSQRLQYYSTQQQQPQVSSADRDLSGRRAGKVKFFDTQKGFGFINDYRAEELGNEEVFVHYTSITAKSGFRSLAEGEEAEYEIVRGPKGYQAANVTGPAGQQVVGDSRSRAPKPAYVSMSPYAAMYPYIQQDPTSFYATTSPYHHPMMLLPQAGYRGPQQHSQAPFRPSPQFPGAPSPYNSPGPLRPYDLGKGFGGMNLGGASVDEGSRHRSAANSTPFGGMFGPLPSFDGSASTPASSAQPYSSGYSYRPAAAEPSGAVGAARSNSLTDSTAPAISKAPTAQESDVHRHSRSSSGLYQPVSKPAGSEV